MSSRRALVRSLSASMSGGVIPAVLGVAATVLANRMGAPAHLVVLLLIWTLNGYLNLTDFGLTRAASSLVSNRWAPRAAVNRLGASSRAIGAALALVTALGLAAYRWWSSDPVPGAIWAMVPLPLITCFQFPLVGALEASGRFGLLALHKTLNAISTYVVPAVLVAFGAKGLAVGVAVIYAYRLASLVWLSSSLPRAAESLSRAEGPSIGEEDVGRDVRSLVTWLGLSSLIGPLFLYIDRAFVAGGSDHQMWIYYVSLSEILLRTYIIPNSALSVFFPVTVDRLRRQPDQVGRVFGRVLPILTLSLGASVAVLGLLAPELLLTSLGLPPADLEKGRLVLALLATGTVVNWFSQSQIALIQAQGRQRRVVVAQASLIAPYATLLVAASGAGITAVALVWTARIIFLAVLLWWLGRRGMERVAATFEPGARTA